MMGGEKQMLDGGENAGVFRKVLLKHLFKKGDEKLKETGEQED